MPVTIFEVDDARHPLWQDELFGPIITLMRVRDFATALLRANDSAYALTGSLYSRSRCTWSRHGPSSGLGIFT